MQVSVICHLNYNLLGGVLRATLNVKIVNCTSRAFDVNFGELIFPDRINYPRPQKIDPFNGIHEVQSDRCASFSSDF